MSKELEALEPSVLLEFIDGLLKRYEGKTDYNIYITKDWLLEIKQALLRLEAIDNTNPSEALECLEKLKGMEISSMPFSDEYGTQEVDLNDIRKVGSQLNTDFREYTTTIKNALLKAQEPKQYLKWEDLKKSNLEERLKVKLNNVKYELHFEKWTRYDDATRISLYLNEFCVMPIRLKTNYEKQFFNDLHLERVEE